VENAAVSKGLAMVPGPKSQFPVSEKWITSKPSVFSHSDGN